MDIKLKIALSGMEIISGWAGKSVRRYEYMGGVILLLPFILTFLSIVGCAGPIPTPPPYFYKTGEQTMIAKYKQNGPDFIRKGRFIRDLTTGKATKHEFINQAKRHSRSLQMVNGGLGQGSLMLK